MNLAMQNIDFVFNQGINTKVDPFKIPIGQFAFLSNVIFDKVGLLKKRNGFSLLTSLPAAASYLTTFNGDLTAIGNNAYSYSQGTNTWITQSTYYPCSTSTLAVVNNSLNQNYADIAVSPLNQICSVYSEINNSTTTYKYTVIDSNTGQSLIAPTAIPGTVLTPPRVYLLGHYFIILFGATVVATTSLQYIAISSTNLSVNAAVTISSSLTTGGVSPFDGVVSNNSLIIAWNGAGASGLKASTLASNLVGSAPATIDSGHLATDISVCVDSSVLSGAIYITYYDSASTNAFITCVNNQLASILAPTQIITSVTVLNLASAAQNGVCSIFYEVSNTYGYDSAIHTNFITGRTCTQSGTLGTAHNVARGLGLASKGFIYNGSIYFLAAYSSPLQPTYFLITPNIAGASANVVAKLAYSNGGGYSAFGVPNAIISNGKVTIPYLFKDFVAATNAAGGVFTQTGVRVVTFNLAPPSICTAEVANNLHVSGGFLWSYDGNSLTENDFHIFPDSVEATTSGSGGSITAQQYQYVAVYEWADNQGNIFRSAPSLPAVITTTGSTSTNTINIPTYRFSYKTNVKITLYRWSAANETFYQITSITAPTLNSLTTDSVAITDTAADSSVIGNNILYTTGGVLDDIGGPSSSLMDIFDTRLWMVDGENSNVLWYSKPILQNTPVEMSDLQTFYVSPSIGVEGSTGVITSIAPMDQNQIVFKKSAIYAIGGEGPDATGASNQYSEPQFITSTIGCTNQNSIVFQPSGLMFQSDRGIWLLGRNLQTSYIGAPVESYVLGNTVLSATSVPGTNQIRFTMNTGVTLMYDYFIGQWSIFTGIPSLSSTLYNNSHTFINSLGQVLQESPGTYMDNNVPVLMGFQTGWINPAGVQGYQRVWWIYLMGSFISPHFLNIGISYDYNPDMSQLVKINPGNYNPNFGLYPGNFGAESPFGGNSAVQWSQVNVQRQSCTAFQLTISEIFNSEHSAVGGQGLTLSHLSAIVGLRKNFPRRLPSTQKYG